MKRQVPGIDRAVSVLEEQLLPRLREMEARIRGTGLYKEIEVVSLRHADEVHATGIRCHPHWAAGGLEYLSLVATVIALKGRMTVRADIQWSDAFDSRKRSGYRKIEASSPARRIRDEDDLVPFIRTWERMLNLFARVARQGKPSLRLVRWLRGAPRDVDGWPP